MRVMRAALLATFALACSACTGSEPPVATTTFLVGAGPDDGTPGFVEVEDGAELTLHPGAQGGFHVYVSFRFDEDAVARFGADPKPLIQRNARRVSTGQLVSRSKHTTPLVPAPGAPTMFDTEHTIPLFLCPSPVGIAVANERLILEVEASVDEDDPEPLKGTLEFVPRCPSGDQETFCMNICFG